MATEVTMWQPGSVPTVTPQHAQSLSPQELVEHRQAIASDVEAILDGYWDRRPDEQTKARILADWSDTLQDWTGEQVLYGLRKWRNENPDKKPNPGHILTMLKSIRGAAELARAKAKVDHSKQTPSEPPATPEARERIMKEADFNIVRNMARPFPKVGEGAQDV